jgi:hypothetical protein
MIAYFGFIKIQPRAQIINSPSGHTWASGGILLLITEEMTEMEIPA